MIILWVFLLLMDSDNFCFNSFKCNPSFFLSNAKAFLFLNIFHVKIFDFEYFFPRMQNQRRYYGASVNFDNVAMLRYDF